MCFVELKLHVYLGAGFIGLICFEKLLACKAYCFYQWIANHFQTKFSLLILFLGSDTSLDHTDSHMHHGNHYTESPSPKHHEHSRYPQGRLVE